MNRERLHYHFSLKKCMILGEYVGTSLKRRCFTHKCVVKHLNSKPYRNTEDISTLCAEKLWNKNPSSASTNISLPPLKT